MADDASIPIKRGRGRPPLYTEEVADSIIQAITDGIPLAEICRNPGMPGVRTVYDWMEVNASFSADIARARKFGYDQIAVNARYTARGEPGFSSGDVQRDKLIVDTDLKLLAKWDPKNYGERQTIEHEGIPSQTSTIDVRNLSPERRELLRELLVEASQPRLEGPVTDAEYEEVGEEGDEE